MDVDGLASPARIRPRGPAGAGRVAAKPERRSIMNSRRGLYVTLFGLFLASGFCGLLYQVVWLRLAFAAFGVITPVLSIVLSVFMLGLSLGSWAGGRWIDALTLRSGRSAAWYYAGAELLIGIGGLLVPSIFSAGQAALLPAGAMDSTRYLFFSALVLGISILPWCILMGFTYPFMMAFIREVDEGNRTSFSYLYLANVIGAMLGHAGHGRGADRNPWPAPHFLGCRRAEFRRRRSQRETCRHKSRP